MTLLRETDEKRGELLLGTAVYFVEGQKQESEIPGSGLRTWPPPGGLEFLFLVRQLFLSLTMDNVWIGCQ